MSVSFVLLFWLLLEGLFKIDLLASMSNAETRRRIIEIDNIQNIDSIRSKTKTNIQITRNHVQKDSNAAVRRIGIVVVLIGIQVYFLHHLKTIKNR